MERKAVALFSGGLDSILAVRLMLDQGIEVRAFHMALDVHPGLQGDPRAREVERAAARLGVPLTRAHHPEEFLQIVRRPAHGYGKNMNPCIDCRLFLLRHAAEHMHAVGAGFLVTGEVVGERPMSQSRNTLRMIEKRCGLLGLVLRPLSARLLEPTRPEIEGVVDRERLLAIQGRSRKPQMELAAKYGITDYPSPAGGCLLTDPGFARRLRDLIETTDALSPEDVHLLKVGRHFRFGPEARIVVGRTHAENEAIVSLRRTGDLILRAADAPGPVTLCRGAVDGAALRAAAALTLRYGQARGRPEAAVNRFEVAESGELLPCGAPLIVSPAEPDALGVRRIG